MKSETNTVPSREAIVDFWAGKLDETKMGADQTDWLANCWRCGKKASLQRCHIIPESLGGGNAPGNFVLLCEPCHWEAPDVRDTNMMITWIYATSSSCREMFSFNKILKCHMEMFGEFPWVDAACDHKKLVDFFVDNYVGLHSGSISPYSLCVVLNKISHLQKDIPGAVQLLPV